MLEKLNEVVIGQPDAIKAIESAVITGTANLLPDEKPIASILFLGPTGVGKTSLIKETARLLHDDPSKLLMINGGDYKLEHYVSRLLGAPPSFIGSDKPPLLTTKALKAITSPGCDISLVAIDEFDKAHPSFQDVIIAMLDGRLTVATGNTKDSVDFSRSIILLTANTGSVEILHNMKTGGLGFVSNSIESYTASFEKAFKKTVRPEVFNRLTEVVVFNTLSKESYIAILSSKLKIIAEGLTKRFGLKVEIHLDDDATNYLLEAGFSPEFGARELLRILNRLIIKPLSLDYLLNKISYGSKLKISLIGSPPTYKLSQKSSTSKKIKYEDTI